MDFDLVVVGGGSGGVRGARTAAALGARVALVEAGRLGGTCVNVGCIPKKLLSYAAHFAEDLHDLHAYGWSVGGTPSFDWGALLAAKDREILRLNGVYERLLDQAGVTLVRGYGRLAGRDEDLHHVAVGDQVLRAPRVLIATGGRPTRPSIPGAELALISDDLFALPALPARIVVVGAGYIACEFASILHGLGVQVTQVMRGDKPLRGFDDEVRHALCEALNERGIGQRPSVSPVRFERVGAEIVTTLSDGEALRSEAVLLATGRAPNTEGLGLAEAGVAIGEDGAIEVDARFATNVPGLFAVGDVVARLELTPVALAEAMVFAHQQFGGPERPPVPYEAVPTAVFTSPQLATVGLGEAEARHRHGEVDIYASAFRPLKHTLTGRAVRSVVKVIVERATDRVLGIHVVDADAAEIVQGFAVAFAMGVTKRQLDATIGIHPTVAEELVTLRTPRKGFSEGTPPRPPHEPARATRRGGVPDGNPLSGEGFSEGTPPRPPHELARATRRGGVPDGNPLSGKG